MLRLLYCMLKESIDYSGLPVWQEKGGIFLEQQYDLIVIGSGVSGMTAALRARAAGVQNIIILEKAPRCGGNSRAAGGVFATSGRTLEAAGYSMDSQAYYESAMEQLQYSVNPELVRAYIFNSGEAVDWLADTGLQFEMKMMPFGCVMATIEDETLAEPYKKQSPTSHSYMGTAMVLHLQKLCEDQNIPIVLSTRAEALLTDESGRVCGVRALQDKTEQVEYHGRAVILSTGGVAGTVASLHEFFPQLFDPDDANFTFGSSHCVGDGIHMAEALGADTRRAMGILLKGPSHLGPGGTQALTYSADTIIVNQYGKRFIDEEKIWNFHAALNNIPGKTTYTVADAKLVNAMSEKMPPQPKPGTSLAPVTLLEGLQQEAKAGRVTCICDTLDEAAAFFGIPAEALKQTVENYNAMCASGKDTELNKNPAHLQPIDTAPYYVLKGIRSTDSTYGGVRINSDFQALRPDGTPIAGLYAVGDVATGFVAEIYAPPGAGFTWSLNSGYLCGKIAAEAIL